VNVSDSKPIIDHFLEKVPVSFEILMAMRDQQATLTSGYGLSGYPANFLLGPNGTVIRRWGGFQEQELRAELDKLGIKRPN
jgi:hypothetical protein